MLVFAFLVETFRVEILQCVHAVFLLVWEVSTDLPNGVSVGTRDDDQRRWTRIVECYKETIVHLHGRGPFL
jgi:hypothetical protein